MKTFSIAIDGASRGNPGAAGIGVVIYDEAGTVIREIGEYIGTTTNNVAEYSALIRGLEEALRMGAKSVRVQTDSELLARQVSGIYRVKAAHLAELYQKVRALFSQFPEARVVHVRRELNAHADRLASDAARRRADYKPEKASGRKPPRKPPASRPGKPASETKEDPKSPKPSGRGQMSLDM